VARLPASQQTAGGEFIVLAFRHRIETVPLFLACLTGETSKAATRGRRSSCYLLFRVRPRLIRLGFSDVPLFLACLTGEKIERETSDPGDSSQAGWPAAAMCAPCGGVFPAERWYQ